MVRPKRARGARVGPCWLNCELAEQEIGAGDVFHFVPGTIHRVRALEDTLIVEVSTADLDDVVRLQDDYGREGTSKP